FSGRTSGALFNSILHTSPIRVGKLNPGLPPELVAMIHKAMEKGADQRYGTAADLKADLQRLKREMESGTYAAASEVARRRSILRSWYWGAATTAIVAAALWVAVSQKVRERAAGEPVQAEKVSPIKVRPSVAVMGFNNLSG